MKLKASCMNCKIELLYRLVDARCCMIILIAKELGIEGYNDSTSAVIRV
jgi:hypothetical protein